MNNSSIITLKSNAVGNNIAFIKKKIGAEVRLSSVVKANAYGHGIEQIVPLFAREGIDHFSVFDFNEALRVHKSLTRKTTIMIMGWIADENIEETIALGFEFFIFNIKRLQLALQYAKQLKKKASIHIETETGMNRSGLNIEELKEAVSIINANKEHFTIKGFCTHLAGAESISNHYRIQNQLKKFDQMYSFIKNKKINPKYRHVANSAASIVYPEVQMDLVRIGIMQYGFWPSTEVFIHYIRNQENKNDPLCRILGWQSKIMAIKEIKTGEFVGYGVSYLAQQDIKTALIPVGYCCGYSRSLSNKGRVLIHGQRCGVIGMVNMNMIIADITNIAHTQLGDKVMIIGQQGDLEIKVSAFSNISDQLNYEILAHLPENIERRVI